MKMRPEHEKKAEKVLGAFLPFSVLGEEEIGSLVRSEDTVLKEFSPGQQVFPCRSVSDAVAVVLSGECRTLADGRIVSVGREGAFLCDEMMSFFNARSVKAVAADACRVLFIKCGKVSELLEKNPGFSSCYSTFTAQLRAKFSTENNSSAEKKAAAAVAEYLLSRPRNAKGEVSLPQDMFRLSKQLNLDKNSLFKAIEVLNSSGTIALSGSAVCIKDAEKLRSFI